MFMLSIIFLKIFYSVLGGGGGIENSMFKKKIDIKYQLILGVIYYLYRISEFIILIWISQPPPLKPLYPPSISKPSLAGVDLIKILERILYD